MNMNNPTLRATIGDLWDYMVNVRRRPHVQLNLAEPADTPMRYLTAVELATLRVEVDLDMPVDPPTHNIAVEAALPIRAWEAHRSQAWKSGRQLAWDLQLYWHPQSHAARFPYRGLELLRHIDATYDDHGVTVWVDTLRGDRYARSRLGDRIADLIYSGASQPAAK